VLYYAVLSYVVGCAVFFFFQAEDGIRDSSVTGVQTCALPIWIPEVLAALFLAAVQVADDRLHRVDDLAVGGDHQPQHPVRGRVRSEERRVGKECRTRWTADQLKKKIE